MNEILIIIKDKKEFFEALNEWERTKHSEPVKEKKAESEETYFTQREAARFLRISLPTLISWKKTSKVPFYQHGRKVLFKKSEVLEAMKHNVQPSKN